MYRSTYNICVLFSLSVFFSFLWDLLPEIKDMYVCMYVCMYVYNTTVIQYLKLQSKIVAVI